mmetsp:Transcript_105251/g.303637  ORF Transcript_105251/g.303637 Transcript_105251/m.303637 type:complete len:247 (+) Transcript_105251:657-1397(+)
MVILATPATSVMAAATTTTTTTTIILVSVAAHDIILGKDPPNDRRWARRVDRRRMCVWHTGMNLSLLPCLQRGRWRGRQVGGARGLVIRPPAAEEDRCHVEVLLADLEERGQVRVRVGGVGYDPKKKQQRVHGLVALARYPRTLRLGALLGIMHARAFEVNDGEGGGTRSKAGERLNTERGADDQREVRLLDLLLHHRRHLYFRAVVAQHSPPKHARAPGGPRPGTGVVALSTELTFGRWEERLVA